MSCPSLPLLLEEALSLQKSPILFLNAELNPLIFELKDVVSYQPFYDKAKQLEGAGIKNSLALPTAQFPLIIMLGQKSKDENLSLFSYALSHVTPGGIFMVCMPNNLGAARFEDKLKEISKLEITTKSKSKCRVFSVTVSSPHKKIQEHFTEIPSPFGTLFSTPGIFSEKEPDAGSLLLAENLPALSGVGADLGSGYGLLSLAALKKSTDIKKIDLYEIDHRALECSQKNLSSYPQCDFIWSDLSSGLKSKAYDWIISNPPFHQSKTQNMNLGKKFIRLALDALKPSGQFCFVQNDHIKYQDCFEGSSANKLVHKDGFIVWELTKVS